MRTNANGVKDRRNWILDRAGLRSGPQGSGCAATALTIMGRAARNNCITTMNAEDEYWETGLGFQRGGGDTGIPETCGKRVTGFVSLAPGPSITCGTAASSAYQRPGCGWYSTIFSPVASWSEPWWCMRPQTGVLLDASCRRKGKAGDTWDPMS
jgi:hypothetical protein